LGADTGILHRRVIGALRSCASIDDLRERSRRRLPRPCFDWLDGAAGSELTAQRNRDAFDAIGLQPRVLVDVARRDQSTRLLGDATSSPLVLAPAGLMGILAPDAETIVARAAERAGIPYCLSIGSTTPLEDVAKAADSPRWFQLYLWESASLYTAVAKRAWAAGYRVLVVTVDTPVSGRRDRDLRNGFRVPPPITAAHAIRRPGWTWRAARGPHVRFANLPDAAATGPLPEVMRRLQNPSATFDDLRKLRGEWPGAFVVKGVMSTEDASAAVDCGADGLVVSNHGGRQLDGAPATIDVLEAIVTEVADRAEVYVDGGVRRGADIAKAIAFGASGVLVGRAYLYGLAAGGAAGVDHALEILRDELDVTLALLGRTSISSIDFTALAASHPHRIQSSSSLDP
jgi:L-lactate dehydrogenase (cytochrome)